MDIKKEIIKIAKEVQADSGDISFFINVNDLVKPIDGAILSNKQVTFIKDLIYNHENILAFDKFIKAQLKKNNSQLQKINLKMTF